MNKDYTHITLLIDRSASMSRQWKNVESGYREIIQENRRADGKCTLTTAAFDNHYDLLEEGTNISKATESLGVFPRGMTALYDAIVRTIQHTRRYISKMPRSRRPAKVLFMIQTDGMENCSREFQGSEGRRVISEMIKEFQEQYDWQFMFLGTDIRSVQDAKNLGFENTIRYSENKTKDSLDLVGKKMVETRACSLDMVGATYSVSSDEEKSLQ